MDSQVKLDWQRTNVIDNRWRQDTLSPGEADRSDHPSGAPVDLPELDSGDQVPNLVPKPPEPKWSDAALSSLLALANGS